MRSHTESDTEMAASRDDPGRLAEASAAAVASRVRSAGSGPGEREEIFRAAFENAPLGICLVGLDGRLSSANPVLCRMLGYSESELQELTLADVTHPDDVSASAQWMDRALQGHATDLQLEKRYLAKQGAIVWAAVHSHLVRGADDSPRFFVSHVQDITARRKADDTQRESDEKLRIAFENAPTGMSVIEPDGRFLAVNPMLCQMCGYSAEELLSATIELITHPDDVERSKLWIRKLISGDLSEPEMEKRYVHRDGHVVWGLVRARWVRNLDGSPRCAVAHIQDVTERRRTEQILRENERQLREAHEIAQMGHWQLGLPSRAMLWGPGVFRLFELDPGTSAASFERFMAFVHPEDRELVASRCPASQPEAASCDLVHRLMLPDGRVKHVRRICRAERDPTGSTVRVSGILQDVTTLKQAEEERARLEERLRRTQKIEAIGLLAGGVAHDFNNLLTAIGGNASLALRRLAPVDPSYACLIEIDRAVESAANLTRQMLAFSRQQIIVPKVLNLNDVIGRLEKMLQRLLGEDLEVATVLDRDLGQVRIDPGQLEQIILNLAVNARDAMAGGGRLTIATANTTLDADYCSRHGNVQPGEYVRLTVSDSGVGMSDEVKARLFEPFFTTKEQGRGTGLGLAMVYGAVRQNNGQIDVASEAGRGTTFTIYIPRVDEPPEQETSAAASGVPGGSETIVLVEDDARVRSLALRVLTQQGYRVSAFSTGEEALLGTRDKDDPVHLLITDVIMPGMNGRVLADSLKRLRPGLKVLFTSGYSQDVIAHHGVLHPGIEFLAKPYSVATLAARAREVLDH